jgi:recombination protein RecR
MSSQINFSSILLENAVNELAKLPGIGRRTALRLALHLLRQEESDVELLGNTLISLRSKINYCRVCHNISDTDICLICGNRQRDGKTLCVVETVRDVMAIENTQQFNGLYHVLGGIISPMDGIGPSNLEIESLIERVKAGGINEIILALSATMEGDTTNFYIYRKIENFPVKITAISRGVAVGDGLEYTDEITLGRSIINRIEFNRQYGKPAI